MLENTYGITAVYEPISASDQASLNDKLEAIAITTGDDDGADLRRRELLDHIHSLEEHWHPYYEEHYRTSVWVSVVRLGDTWMIEATDRDWEVAV